LEPIFSSEDIKAQLKEESVKFTFVNKTFLESMADVMELEGIIFDESFGWDDYFE